MWIVKYLVVSNIATFVNVLDLGIIIVHTYKRNGCMKIIHRSRDSCDEPLVMFLSEWVN